VLKLSGEGPRCSSFREYKTGVAPGCRIDAGALQRAADDGTASAASLRAP